jgi:hypothetical protein
MSITARESSLVLRRFSGSRRPLPWLAAFTLCVSQPSPRDLD